MWPSFLNKEALEGKRALFQSLHVWLTVIDRLFPEIKLDVFGHLLVVSLLKVFTTAHGHSLGM